MGVHWAGYHVWIKGRQVFFFSLCVLTNRNFKAPDGSKVARVDSPSQWVLVKGVAWSGRICAEACSSGGAWGEGFQQCSINKDWAWGSMEMVWCHDWNRSTAGDLKVGSLSSWCWMAKLEIAVGSAAGDGG